MHIIRKKSITSQKDVTVSRREYTRTSPSGKLVRVKTTTYKKVGSPVKSRGAKQGIYSAKRGYSPWITKTGKLGGKGYLSKTSDERRKILDMCVKNYGYRSCLGSIMVLERSAVLKEKYGRRLTVDRKYLVGKYGGKGTYGRKSPKRPLSPKKENVIFNLQD